MFTRKLYMCSFYKKSGRPRDIVIFHAFNLVTPDTLSIRSIASVCFHDFSSLEKLPSNEPLCLSCCKVISSPVEYPRFDPVCLVRAERTEVWSD